MNAGRYMFKLETTPMDVDDEMGPSLSASSGYSRVLGNTVTGYSDLGRDEND